MYVPGNQPPEECRGCEEEWVSFLPEGMEPWSEQGVRGWQFCQMAHGETRGTEIWQKGY